MKRATVSVLLAAALLAAMSSALLAAAPTTISDLRVQATHIQAAYLVWTVPTDPGGVGLGRYDVRYSTSPIDEGNWASATQASGEPTPGTPGATERFIVTGLASDTLYYFAVKTSDASEPPNVSAISNVPSGRTLPAITPVVVHNPWIKNDRVADTHNITTMGATYVNDYTPNGVVAPVSDEAKAINIYNNQKRRLYHWADEPPGVGGDINDPTYNQNVFGWSLCGRHASQACTIAQAAGGGLSQRRIGLPGHWIYEVQYGDGTFHAYDTMTTMYVYNKATPRKVASCAEMKADTTLLANAVADGRACPGFLLCGDSVSGYQSMINSWSSYGSGAVATTWNGNMDLRFGQSFLRTWEAWQNEHPTPVTDADSGNIPGPDAPYHHECQNDWKDTVNYNYWEPYGQVISYIHTSKATYRRWSNGTDTLTPDFRSAGYQSMLDGTSHDVATYYNDGVTPDLHGATVGVQGEAIFKIDVPFYITDASFSGDFVKTNAGDVCKVYVSTNGTSWTQVYDAPIGTTNVANQNLRTLVFGTNGRWKNWWIKVQVKGSVAKSDAGVSNLVVTTIFEHNKGAMAYLDKGVNHITVTFDNPGDLTASTLFKITYKWKEYSGSSWSVDKIQEMYVGGSPATFTITTGGTKVPRTEYILMEVVPPPLPDDQAPAAVTDLNAVNPDSTRLDLTWTATGDDGVVGQATAYEIRYSTSNITAANWDAATPVASPPAPAGPGTTETFTVTGLNPLTLYYFGLKVRDEGGNVSELSNVASLSTTAADVTPPAQVTDLTATTSTTAGAIDLAWTAPGDDGMTGTASSYDIRYSTGPIAESNWAAATVVAGVAAPQAGGTAETLQVAGLTAGTRYYFALKATDESSNVSALSHWASAKPALMGEKVLQTGLNNYNGTRDTYIMGDSTSQYYWNERMTICGYYDFGPGNVMRGLVRFDLSGQVPPGVTLTSAKLWMYSYNVAQTKGSAGYYNVHPITQDWTDTECHWTLAKAGVNWTTPGGTFAPTPDAQAPKKAPTAVPDWYNWNVTARVQSWLAGTSTNYGWIIKCDDENRHNQDYLYQYDTANASFRPKLVLSDIVTAVVGDVNGDTHVDVSDLLFVAAAWGAPLGDPDYNPLCDFNGDNVIDVSDLLLMAAQWGT
jgi:hypothetical protein